MCVRRKGVVAESGLSLRFSRGASHTTSVRRIEVDKFSLTLECGPVTSQDLLKHILYHLDLDMHYALRVNEIFESICNFADIKTLSCLTRTYRSFEEPSRNVGKAQNIGPTAQIIPTRCMRGYG